MAYDLATEFARLSTTERSSALEKLVHTLTIDERGAVSALIHSQNDPTVRLPVELLIQIFTYLDILDAWTLQLVNRRWRQVLASEQFLKAALARWNSHDATDNGRSHESTAGDSMDDRVRHMVAVRRGKPVTQTVLDVIDTGHPGPQPPLSQRRLDLKGDRVAYIAGSPRQSNEVILHSLATGNRTIFHGEARERLLAVVLTTSFLAFTTFEGLLYVAKLVESPDQPQQWPVQLPSSRIRASAGHEGTIVLATGGGGISSSYVDTILVYDAHDRRLSSIPLGTMCRTLEDRGLPHSPCALMVDSTCRVIDIFTLVSDGPEHLEHSLNPRYLGLTHLRISLDGTVVCSTTHQHEMPSGFKINESQFTVAPPQPTGHRNEYRIQVGNTALHRGSNLIFDAYFNNRTCVLIAPDLDERRHCLISSQGHIPSRIKPFDNHFHAEWKGLQFALEPPSGSQWAQYTTLVNETFLVNIEINRMQGTGRARIMVWCFDEKVKMDGAGEYKYFPDADVWEDAHEWELSTGKPGLSELFWFKNTLMKMSAGEKGVSSPKP